MFNLSKKLEKSETDMIILFYTKQLTKRSTQYSRINAYTCTSQSQNACLKIRLTKQKPFEQCTKESTVFRLCAVKSPAIKKKTGDRKSHGQMPQR